MIVKIDQASTPFRVRCARPLRLAGPTVALALLAATAAAQNSRCPFPLEPTMDLADVWSTRLRASQLTSDGPAGSLTIRRPSLERKSASCPATADTAGNNLPTLLPVRARVLFNSAYPLDINTGAVWAGRGANLTAELGGTYRIGPLGITAYPLIAYQQNRAFRTAPAIEPGASPFANGGHGGIDWPQRHGDASFWTVHPGQSAVQLSYRGVAAGISTENLWIGPAQRMPLLLSPTGAGFPHIFLATERPIDVAVGRLEAQLFWGRLQESDYFDGDEDNDRNLLVGTTATFEPGFARGLFIGAHRSYVMAYDQPEWSIFDYALNPFIGVRDNPPEDNRLFSLFARWVLSAAEFEAYAEWSREDAWGPWVDLLREPNHSQAYLLGFQKLGRLGETRLRWWGELAHLEASSSLRSGRGVVTYYTHAVLRQGYTNRGQLLGAWIGPGSDSQLLGVDRIAGRATTGIALERVRFDADAYYSQWARYYAHNGHDTSLALWLRHSDALNETLRFSLTGSIARRQNRNFVYFTGDQPPVLRWETNTHLDVELRWLPGRR